MAELRSWADLPAGGVVSPARAEVPTAGDWRTAGRPELELGLCVNCLLCWLYCPDSAMELDETTLVGIDYLHCKGCELCVEVCPTGALAMMEEAT